MRREFSAGGVVFKRTDDDVLWLIIKRRPSELFPAERYQLPKGHIETGESTEQTAIREVFEETGIRGKILAKLGSNKFVFSMGEEKIFKVVTYLLMEYVSGELTENAEVEKLFWLPFSEAKDLLTFANDKELLEKASNIVGGS